jgi:DNA-binding transcriptional MerR regulator
MATFTPKSNLPESTQQEGDVFLTGEIATLLGVSSEEVDYWARRKLITSSVRGASGHGSRRLFNRNDLRRAFLVQRLRQAKWKPKQIAKALVTVNAVLNNPSTLHTPLLVHEGNSLLILCRDRGKEPILLDAASSGQQVMVIALETLEEETLTSLARSK